MLLILLDLSNETLPLLHDFIKDIINSTSEDEELIDINQSEESESLFGLQVHQGLLQVLVLVSVCEVVLIDLGNVGDEEVEEDDEQEELMEHPD